MTFDNYRSILDNDLIVHSFWNTVLITLPATLLVVGIASLAAYAFAWIDFPGRDWTFVIVVALLVVPIQVALIPVASLYGRLGIFGDILGVVLFHVAFGLPFAIFLLRNFFAGIPHELLEAARIDGASELKVFRTVVLPIGLPAIASLAIFQFLWVWNDLLVGLVFADTSHQPLTVAIRSQLRQFGTNFDVIAPGRVPVDARAPRGVLRLPALLRAGPARRLRPLTALGPCPFLRQSCGTMAQL